MKCCRLLHGWSCGRIVDDVHIAVFIVASSLNLCRSPNLAVLTCDYQAALLCSVHSCRHVKSVPGLLILMVSNCRKGSVEKVRTELYEDTVPQSCIQNTARLLLYVAAGQLGCQSILYRVECC
jgi:hypothetical protein